MSVLLPVWVSCFRCASCQCSLVFGRIPLDARKRCRSPRFRVPLKNRLISFAVKKNFSEKNVQISEEKELEFDAVGLAESVSRKVEDELSTASIRASRRKAERHAYLFAAVASTLGITSMAAAAVYYRFVWQAQGGVVPYLEMFGTFALAVGATVGMEYWARWAHKSLWHASLWHMHESHHRPREGPFELNDVFAIINAVPAIALLAYGFFNQGLVPGLAFGAGLGITTFGMAYMFVHDGLVHRRFPVGPIADVPYLRKVAAAHQLHHADKFKGVPYGLFLGPKELEEVGGWEELEKLLSSKSRASQTSGNKESS
eukprot:TRINITY_DN1188_c0_g1_i1.p1 TRINITY_DN1188_c0_g1~~TRINITY_DN1188_c0_g1_i1.p1  ORF type:complete len:315 (-),score=46.19 TRINITY_DN1188_c0_g1_i1:292-1236(-)